MKEYDVNKVRNIAFAGHNGSGKTSLAEAVFYINQALQNVW